MSFFCAKEIFVNFITVFQDFCINEENNLLSNIRNVISCTFRLSNNRAEFRTSQKIIGIVSKYLVSTGRGIGINIIQQIVFTKYAQSRFQILLINTLYII